MTPHLPFNKLCLSCLNLHISDLGMNDYLYQSAPYRGCLRIDRLES